MKIIRFYTDYIIELELFNLYALQFYGNQVKLDLTVYL